VRDRRPAAALELTTMSEHRSSVGLADVGSGHDLAALEARIDARFELFERGASEAFERCLREQLVTLTTVFVTPSRRTGCSRSSS
jgi:uncharacterized membrane-anchored protein